MTEPQSAQTFWKKEITTGQLLSIIVPVVIACIISFIKLREDVIKLEYRIITLEQGSSERAKAFDKINNSLEAFYQRDADFKQQVLIKLENKKDR